MNKRHFVGIPLSGGGRVLRVHRTVREKPFVVSRRCPARGRVFVNVQLSWSALHSIRRSRYRRPDGGLYITPKLVCEKAFLDSTVRGGGSRRAGTADVRWPSSIIRLSRSTESLVSRMQISFVRSRWLERNDE